MHTEAGPTIFIVMSLIESIKLLLYLPCFYSTCWCEPTEPIETVQPVIHVNSFSLSSTTHLSCFPSNRRVEQKQQPRFMNALLRLSMASCLTESIKRLLKQNN